VLARGAHRPYRDLGPVLRVHRVLPLEVNDRTWGTEVEALVHVVPDDRLDSAGAVGDEQLQEVLSGAPREAVALAHDEGARDPLPLGQVAHEDATRLPWG